MQNVIKIYLGVILTDCGFFIRYNIEELQDCMQKISGSCRNVCKYIDTSIYAMDTIEFRYTNSLYHYRILKRIVSELLQQ